MCEMKIFISFPGGFRKGSWYTLFPNKRNLYSNEYTYLYFDRDMFICMTKNLIVLVFKFLQFVRFWIIQRASSICWRKVKSFLNSCYEFPKNMSAVNHKAKVDWFGGSYINPLTPQYEMSWSDVLLRSYTQVHPAMW